ncbi:hypothetical protein [Paenibacillus eucommiae]|uniref:Uncharacterized protein n=1 Tax=Paenibacillus eucommiae TaxID=1355755 RepID=A0ABS4J309_9BACL|nr:hypothetical protein [Paenibacillus eucommiae]MBP1994219.1 hypothetical protein [Paenibacillus eucommiae]
MSMINTQKKGQYTGCNCSEGNMIFYGSTLLDEAGQLWEIVAHDHLPTPYMKRDDDSTPIPLRAELIKKRKWFVKVT